MNRLINYLFFLDKDYNLENIVPIKNKPEVYQEEEYVEAIFIKLILNVSFIKKTLLKQAQTPVYEQIPLEKEYGNLVMEIHPLKYSKLTCSRVMVSFIDNKFKGRNQLLKQKIEKNEIVNHLDEFTHEIKNAVNVIYGISEIMNEGIKEESLELLPTLNNSVKHLKNLVGNYLQNRKYESLRWKRDLFDVNDEIMYLVDQYSHLKNSLSKNIKYDIDPRISRRLIGYPSAVRQVLINLISNAMEHSEEVEILLKVDFIREDLDELVLNFSVSDSGPGIPKEILDRLFERGQSLKLKQNSFGLGLNISKGILNSLQSDLIVWSEVGKGTRFNFELTLQKQIIDQFQNKPAESYFNLLNFDGKKALIVDDDHLNRLIATKNLTKFGIHSYSVSNGVLAIQELYESHFDVLLLDINLPILDGVSLFHLVKERFPELKVIVCSASIDSQFQESIRNQGIRSFLEKPYSLEHLGEMLAIELID